MGKTSIEGISFMAVVVLVTTAFVFLLLPYYGAVLWATIVAILFHPLHEALCRWFGGRRNLAAAAGVICFVCIVLIPGSIVLASLADEATRLYGRISQREFDALQILQRIRDALPSPVIDALGVFQIGDLEQIQSRIASSLGQAVQTIASRAISIGQGTMELTISLGIMLYLLFFLFRDGPELVTTISKASPLSQRYTDQILQKFASVMKATVKGNVIIASIQGSIGGITFWLIGIEAALLWGALMALLSLLPAIGAALVWFPAAVYLLATGSYLKAVALMVVGALVIGMVDNILRPQLVGKDLRLPDYLILISTIGGISLFGMNGFVLGPLIAALFVAVWSSFALQNTSPEQQDTQRSCHENGKNDDRMEIS